MKIRVLLELADDQFDYGEKDLIRVLRREIDLMEIDYKIIYHCKT